MTTTLSEMKTRLRAELGRGTSQDSSLHGYLRSAIKHVERKDNFHWMFNLIEVKNNLQAEQPRTFKLPNRKIKKFEFCRITAQDDEPLDDFWIVKQVFDANKLTPPITDEALGSSGRTVIPNMFMLARDNLIILNETPRNVFTFEFGVYEYTQLAANDGSEHWLFDNFEDGIIALAVHYSAKFSRDYERAAAELQLATPLIDDLIASKEELEFGSAEIVMQQDFSRIGDFG